MSKRVLDCMWCGKTLEVMYQPDRKYCSHRCAGFARADKNKKEIKQCLSCDQNFESYKAGNRKYCSVKCTVSARTSLKGTTRECVICGNSFEPHHKNQKCCSYKCQAVVSNRKLIEKLAKTKRVCQGCGKEYTPLRNNQIYCSKNCRDRVYARNNPDYTSAKGHRYRSRMASVEHEEFIASEIYERDRWRCGICGKKVNKKLRHPDLLSPTLDHITPLSLGGPHTRDNVQLAHYICNIKKGNRNIMPNEKGQFMIV